ncbi:hypothetical protein CLAVI_000402 [Candidatus Clavichlamydia salmonicola]|uniref:hypothetical protein n=1 Tax=Candidatus Clavichlamydia salmonicola TaxID=469812 RepID=UPI001891627B|nr:hypothetical protein [Candidatus Clavichlamydia salmonicola]MBF5050783.1 hypothetical protein [Candidatus Clavichlamydia salmonicola]
MNDEKIGFIMEDKISFSKTITPATLWIRDPNKYITLFTELGRLLAATDLIYTGLDNFPIIMKPNGFIQMLILSTKHFSSERRTSEFTNQLPLLFKDIVTTKCMYKIIEKVAEDQALLSIDSKKTILSKLKNMIPQNY